tara:strand:- start:504 stop:740 length:237 start_codon:yes stop_codon:yes gene_type:complete
MKFNNKGRYISKKMIKEKIFQTQKTIAKKGGVSVMVVGTTLKQELDQEKKGGRTNPNSIMIKRRSEKELEVAKYDCTS